MLATSQQVGSALLATICLVISLKSCLKMMIGIQLESLLKYASRGSAINYIRVRSEGV
jgi:hypothetical protein